MASPVLSDVSFDSSKLRVSKPVVVIILTKLRFDNSGAPLCSTGSSSMSAISISGSAGENSFLAMVVQSPLRESVIAAFEALGISDAAIIRPSCRSKRGSSKRHAFFVGPIETCDGPQETGLPTISTAGPSRDRAMKRKHGLPG